MSPETTTRERARGWLLASSIAALALAIFAAAVVLGRPSPSDAAEMKPEVPEYVAPELPREWRWERKAITFDHMFRQIGRS